MECMFTLVTFLEKNCYALLQNGLCALHLASKAGHADIAMELLRRGANCNAITLVGIVILYMFVLPGVGLIQQEMHIYNNSILYLITT